MRLSENMAVDIDMQKYRSIVITAEGMWLSFKKTVRFCGGEKRVKRLIEEGKLRFEKDDGAPNTMWRFNAADVFRNPRPLTRGGRNACVK